MTDDIYQASRDAFSKYAGIDAPEVPGGDIARYQVRLARWERAQFGIVDDTKLVLGIAEELGEMDDAKTLVKRRDAIGDILIFACQLANSNRLDFGVLMESEEIEITISSALGRLAHATLKASQGIRGYDDPEKRRRAIAEGLWSLIGSLRLFAHMVLDISGFHQIFVETAEHVLKREWHKDSLRGGQE